MSGTNGEPIPDIFTDGFTIASNLNGSTIMFTVSGYYGSSPIDVPVLTLRVPLTTLKLLSMLSRQHLKSHERNTGIDVRIPAQVMNQMGISEEDW